MHGRTGLASIGAIQAPSLLQNASWGQFQHTDPQALRQAHQLRDACPASALKHVARRLLRYTTHTQNIIRRG